MLQIRLYALYQRSKLVLAFLAACFLAEVAAMSSIYINFSSTVKGWPSDSCTHHPDICDPVR